MSQASFSDDATGVVKAIQDGVKTETIEINNELYTTRPVYLAPDKPRNKQLDISTLDGLIEYINENVDRHNFSDLLIVVNNPRSVSVRSQIGGESDIRLNWLDADYDIDGFPFGRYLSHEEFVVGAQTHFLENLGDRETLLKFIGNITAAQIQTSTDDGISQTVVVESGVRKSEVELPNPVVLNPRRTFAEVAQPPSPFVLRVRKGRDGQLPEIALYEADGGLWRIEAITHIKRYINENLNEDLTIPVIG